MRRIVEYMESTRTMWLGDRWLGGDPLVILFQAMLSTVSLLLVCPMRCSRDLRSSVVLSFLISSEYPRNMCKKSANTSPDQLGTLAGLMAGGQRRPLRYSPGNTPDGDAKKAVKHREKKFGVLPGKLKVSLGIWMKM